MDNRYEITIRISFAVDILKCTILDENIWISIKTAQKFVPGSLNDYE